MRRALERLDAPVADFVEIDVECRFVELDDIRAGCFDPARFFVEDFGKRPRELFPAPVVRVVECVDHRHRTGQRDLHLVFRCAAQKSGVLDEHWVPAGDGADHDGDIGVVAIAYADGLRMLEIHTFKSFEKRRHEMPTGLLAVGDDIDSSLDLVAQHQTDRVAHALLPRLAFEAPRCP